MSILTFAQRQAFNDSIGIQFMVDVGGKRAFAQPMAFSPVEEGQFMPAPAVTLVQADAQRLIDQLWHCGLRPSEGTGSAGSLAATERHLADMRAIALGSLNLKS